MELREIKLICEIQIFAPTKQSEKQFIFRRYDTFLDWFDMSKKRNTETLKKVDYQLKKNGISLWAGKEQRKSVLDFNRGETITFRFSDRENQQSGLRGSKNGRVNNPYAGTIEVVNEESGIKLYKHQEDAIQNLQDKIVKTNKNPFAGLLVLPTGGGKTLTMAYWLAKNYLAKDRKILWIAHRHELLEQAKATFHHRLAFKDILGDKTSFNYRLISGLHDKPVHIRATDDIIISSKDSLNSGFEYLHKNWLKGNKEVFLVVDEAHHATAKTYRKLISNLKEKVEQFQMIGLTATPFRTAENEQGLLAKVFPDDIVYKIDLRSLISRGILSEPIFEEVSTEMDMTKVISEEQLENLKYFDIDSIGRETAKTIAENDARNWVIVNRYVKNRKKYKQTIVFALNQDNAIALRKLFLEKGVKADYVLSAVKDSVDGFKSPSRVNKEKIDRFRNGELDVLINVNILTEGMDVPKVQSVFLARPTISSILMTQMIGRGLRGEKAGGTKDAYIVSFIDEWKDKVAWVNPEKLFIEENIDFDDKDVETKKRLIRLISISKIEEFAILTNQILDITAKLELEKLDFIERIPLGIYHFTILDRSMNGEERAKHCEILIYDNIRQSYLDFINSLPLVFKKHKLSSREYLTDDELSSLAQSIDDDYFFGCVKQPGYNIQDIKDVLQFYAQNEDIPKYIELKDRKKYDISVVAKHIIDSRMDRIQEEEYRSALWESNESEWQTFFGYDKRYFISEIDLAIRRMLNPDLYQRSPVIPTDTKELRALEMLSMPDLRERNPEYWKHLSDQVYQKHLDKDGYYVSASGEFKSKHRHDFQIDHIVPRQKGGLSVLDNLQLLTRKENALKGTK